MRSEVHGLSLPLQLSPKTNINHSCSLTYSCGFRFFHSKLQLQFATEKRKRKKKSNWQLRSFPTIDYSTKYSQENSREFQNLSTLYRGGSVCSTCFKIKFYAFSQSVYDVCILYSPHNKSELLPELHERLSVGDKAALCFMIHEDWWFVTLNFFLHFWKEYVMFLKWLR